MRPPSSSGSSSSRFSKSVNKEMWSHVLCSNLSLWGQKKWVRTTCRVCPPHWRPESPAHPSLALSLIGPLWPLLKVHFLLTCWPESQFLLGLWPYPQHQELQGNSRPHPCPSRTRATQAKEIPAHSAFPSLLPCGCPQVHKAEAETIFSQSSKYEVGPKASTSST